jgi:glycerol transport system ATP-binding protein
VHDLTLGEDLTVWLDPRHVYVFDEQGKMIAPASYALAA